MSRRPDALSWREAGLTSFIEHGADRWRFTCCGFLDEKLEAVVRDEHDRGVVGFCVGHDVWW